MLEFVQKDKINESLLDIGYIADTLQVMAEGFSDEMYIEGATNGMIYLAEELRKRKAAIHDIINM